MTHSTKDAWLSGPGDLQEADVEDVPVKGQSVRVRGLPAAYSNRAQAQALELITGKRGEQSATVNVAKLEEIQFAHGCVEPKFTEQEASVVAQKYGPAFKKVVAKIDDLSGLDKQTIQDTNARFRSSDASENGRTLDDGTGAGDDEPDVSMRAGA